jgi:hypothetical protein
MTYVGPPYYYGVKRISPIAGTLSVNSHVVTSEFVFWVGPKGFYIYDGSVRPLAPDVSDHYRDSLNFSQIAKAACGHNPQFKEIWTFFVSKDSNEIDSYVLWNYEDNTWVIGDLVRTCWDEAAIWDQPVATLSSAQEGITGLEKGLLAGNRTSDPIEVYENGGIVGFDLWQKVFDTLGAGTPVNNLHIENFVLQPGFFGGSPDWVEGVDYEIDLTKGLLKLLSTGGIVNDDAMLAFYDVVETNYCTPYNHEDGYTNDGADRSEDIWLEMAPFEIGVGDKLAVVKRIIQDTGREDDLDPLLNSNAIEILFKTRLAPEAAAIIEGPYTLDTERGYTDARFTGRQVAMRVQQVKNELWRLGKFRLDIVPGSGR